MNRYAFTGRAVEKIRGAIKKADTPPLIIPNKRTPPLDLIRAKSIKIFEVVSNATGDGVYNCYENQLIHDEWTDTDGTDRFENKNTTSVEVLNLEESDTESSYSRALIAGDRLAAWQITDDEWTSRWVGIPFENGAGKIHLAYCKTAAGSGTTIVCYLDTDGTGEEITINFTICNGSNLNEATPLLEDGTRLTVVKIGSNWYHAGGPFAGSCITECACVP